jgi:hypothetical protein
MQFFCQSSERPSATNAGTERGGEQGPCQARMRRGATKMLLQMQVVRLHHEVELPGAPDSFPGRLYRLRQGFRRKLGEDPQHSLSLRDKNCHRCPAPRRNLRFLGALWSRRLPLFTTKTPRHEEEKLYDFLVASCLGGDIAARPGPCISCESWVVFLPSTIGAAVKRRQRPKRKYLRGKPCSTSCANMPRPG